MGWTHSVSHVNDSTLTGQMVPLKWLFEPSLSRQQCSRRLLWQQMSGHCEGSHGGCGEPIEALVQEHRREAAWLSLTALWSSWDFDGLCILWNMTFGSFVPVLPSLHSFWKTWIIQAECGCNWWLCQTHLISQEGKNNPSYIIYSNGLMCCVPLQPHRIARKLLVSTSCYQFPTSNSRKSAFNNQNFASFVLQILGAFGHLALPTLLAAGRGKCLAMWLGDIEADLMMSEMRFTNRKLIGGDLYKCFQLVHYTVLFCFCCKVRLSKICGFPWARVADQGSSLLESTKPGGREEPFCQLSTSKW